LAPKDVVHDMGIVDPLNHGDKWSIEAELGVDRGEEETKGLQPLGFEVGKGGGYILKDGEADANHLDSKWGRGVATS
jgi:hypothetical protein